MGHNSLHPLFSSSLFGGMAMLLLIVPLGLLCYYAVAGNAFSLLILASLLLLVGNFFLSYWILTAGVRVPVYP